MYQNIITVRAFLETIELCQDTGFEIVGVLKNLKGEICGFPIIADYDAIRLHNEYSSCGIVLSQDSPKVK